MQLSHKQKQLRGNQQFLIIHYHLPLVWIHYNSNLIMIANMSDAHLPYIDFDAVPSKNLPYTANIWTISPQ